MAEQLHLVTAVVATLALLLTLLRFVRGPSLTDRVVALDVSSIVVISLIALMAVVSGRGIYLDVALVYGLLGFLGVLVVARFLERGL